MGESAMRRDASDGAFLAYNTYVARFAKDVVSLQRLWIVFLALCAFWLAIENSYVQFQAIGRDYIAWRGSLDAYSRSRAAAAESAAAVGRPGGEMGPSANGVAGRPAVGAGLPEDRKAEFDARKAALDARKADIDKLKREAVNLTVAGTQMPSRLPYAPTLWLASLFAWLALFGTLRMRAHKNLAAAVVAYGGQHVPFGLAEESSVWLAPIPSEVALRARGEMPERVERPAMLAFLGWTATEEGRSRTLARIAWGLVGLLVLRIGLIASDVNGPLALELRFTDDAYRLLSLVGAAGFAALAILFLLSLSSSGGAGKATLISSRRDALVAIVGAGALLGLLWNRHAIVRAASGGGWKRPDDPLTRIGGTPRFVSRTLKRKRLHNYRVEIRLAKPGDVLLNVRGLKGNVQLDRNAILTNPLAVHGVSSSGTLRFYSEADGLGGLRRLAPAALRQLAANSLEQTGPALRDYRHTASLEAAALARFERGDLIGACDVLLAACRISIRAERINLRLFDLLAGLAARYPAAAPYRAALRPLFAQRAATSPPGPPDPLLGRRSAWANPIWLARWTGRRPVRWGHPFEQIRVQPRNGKSRPRGEAKLKARPVLLRHPSLT